MIAIWFLSLPSRLKQPCLPKEKILSPSEFHGCGASFVVIYHRVDPSAHGIAPHQPSIVGFQQFGRRSHIRHPRIEPEIVRIRIKDDWHAVMDWCGHSIRRRCQNRAGFYRVAASIIPAIPVVFILFDTLYFPATGSTMLDGASFERYTLCVAFS